MQRRKLSIRIIFFIFFIFIMNFLAMQFHWYSSIWYFDMPMHFLGGFWLGILILWLFLKKDDYLVENVFNNLNFKFILKLVLLALIIGLLWEVFEILVDRTISQNPFNILDTFSDLSFDTAGALFAVFYFFRKVMLKKEYKI